jgi:predicted lipid-binding transport protein (Tim44 family)
MTRSFTLPALSPALLRRAGVLAGVSFLLGLLLVTYLFGLSDHFFGRLFGAFFVLFWLLAVTFLGVVPFVNWAATRWFGKEWSDEPTVNVRRARPASASVATNNRKPTRPVPRQNTPKHP